MRTLACLLLGAAMVGLYDLLPRTCPGPPFRAALPVLSGFILAPGGLRAEVRDRMPEHRDAPKGQCDRNERGRPTNGISIRAKMNREPISSSRSL